MSRENVEVVRRFFDAVNGGNIDTELERFDSSIEFDWSASRGPYKGRYHGPRQIARWLNDVRDTWEELRFEPVRFTAVRDRYVVVANRLHGRGRISGLDVVGEGAQVWTFDGGRAVHVRLYQSERDALEAVGLRE